MRKLGKLGLFATWLTCAQLFGCSDSQEPSVDAATTQQLSGLRRLEEQTGSRWQVVMNRATGVARHVRGGRTASVLGAGKEARQAAYAFLSEHVDLFGIANPEQELTLTSTSTSALGVSHARFQQHVHGVPVKGGEVSVHFDRSGAINYVVNHYVPSASSLATVAQLTSDAAVQAALHAQRQSYPGFSSQLLSGEVRSRLMIYADRAGASALAYQVTLYVNGSKAKRVHPGIFEYAIDARSAAVLSVVNTLKTYAPLDEFVDMQVRSPASAQHRARPQGTDAIASGTGESGEMRQFHVTDEGGSFSMVDITRADGGIETSSPNSIFTSNAKDSGWDPGGIDGHFNAEVSYDYYKTLGRDGIDGNGGVIKSVVHANEMNNAHWDGDTMTYGEGSSSPFTDGSFARAIDVGAHEMTHGVTQYTSGLDYTEGQVGGLNEAMSDIFGALVEHTVDPNVDKNFLGGENITEGNAGLRSMINPKLFEGCVDMVSEADGINVHYSSGPPNNVFALLTAGGTHNTSKVEVPFGIGWEKSGKLWYETQIGGVLLSRSEFADAREATLKAADDLGFTENEKNIVDCAWIAIGVPDGASCKTIVDPTGGAGGMGGAGGSAGAGGASGGAAGTAGTGGASGGAGGLSGSGGAGAGGVSGGTGGIAGTSGGAAGSGGSGLGGGAGSAGAAGSSGGAGASGVGGVGVGGNEGSPGPAATEGGCACRLAPEHEPTHIAGLACLAVIGAGVARRRRR